MVKYCEFCRELHDENQLCERYKRELEKHPQWLSEATEFATLAAQYHLITSQTLDRAASAVNKVLNTDLSYEGTRQVARDIQVFAKLNSDSFRNSGQFSSAQAAQEAVINSSEGFQRYLHGRLNGTGQEIDWLMSSKGKLDSLLYKYQLPDGNTVGYDGIKINRFTGKTVERITIKAAESQSGLHTNAVDVVEALEKGSLKSNDTVWGVKGIDKEINKVLDSKIDLAQKNGDTELVKKLQDAKENLKITERGDFDQVKRSTKRLSEKVESGKGSPQITGAEVASKMLQGAVIGAAISLTVSSVRSFIRYKKGEITPKEAFGEIGEETTKGALVGGTMAGVTLFLPGGIIGFVAGLAIGVYVSAVFGNVLDEIFGKGFYAELLHAEGYIVGTAKNIEEMMREFGNNVISTQNNNRASSRTLAVISSKEKTVSDKLSKLADSMEGL